LNETTENYNPDQQVVRSTQSTSDKSTTTEADKGVSVQNNLPNADAGQAPAGSQQQKQEETTNYEIGKTVRTLMREQPQIARLSLAVMIDGVMQTGTDGKPTWSERSADEVARIKRLVQSAVGFDEKRGDKVEVVSMRFTAPEDMAGAAASSGLFGLSLDKSDLLGLGQSAILAVVVLLALLFVLRPMALRLSAITPNGMLAMGDALLAAPEAMSMAGPAISRPGTAGGAAVGAAMIADESMVNMANVEGQLRASSIRRLAEMVEKHPDESLSIMRGWITQEAR
jgi:flagellar M-ring protein FliF